MIQVVPERNEKGENLGTILYGRDVTSVRESEVRLRHFVDNLPGMVFAFRLTPAGAAPLLHLNGSVEKLLGLNPEMVAKSEITLLDLIHPEDRPRIAADLVSAALSQAPFHEEIRLCPPGQAPLWVELRAKPVRDDEACEAGNWYGIMLDVSERKTFQQRMELLELAINRIADAIYLLDDHLRVYYANDAACRIHGYTREEMQSLTLLDFNPDLTQEAARELMARLDKGEQLRFETHHSTKDGRIYPVEVSGVIVDFDGRRFSLTVARDISERQRYLEALQHSEREFRQLAENVPDTIARWNLEGRYLYVNPAFERISGASLSQMLGETPCLNQQETKTALEQVIANGRSVTLQRQAVPTQEGERLFDMNLVPEFDEHQKVVSVLCVGYDLTDTYRFQERIAKNEQNFRTLMESLPDPVIRYDRDLRRTYVSPAFARLTGVSSQDLLGRTVTEKWLVNTSSQDAQAYQQRLRQVLSSGQPDDWEQSVSLDDGRVNVLNVRGLPERGADGQVAGVLTVFRDVTAKRAMESQLRMSASVFLAAREGIMITDQAGSILDVNPAFTRITGYGKEEVIGQNPRLLSSGLHPVSFYKKLWNAVLEGGSWSGEIVNRRKDGQLFDGYLDIVRVRDDVGSGYHLVGVFSDITQLKRHEQHLEHLANHDALTGLPNRLLLADRLAQAIAKAKRARHTLAVFFLDLDDFKPINDTHGHEMGDRVLKEISARLSGCLREGDTVARVGGDEFVVLINESAYLERSEIIARRLLDAIIQPITLDGLWMTLSASIGISLYPEDADQADILLRHADQAMYIAKSLGRNHFIFYGDEAREISRGKAEMIHDLHLALEQDQLSVHYQPIVEMATGRVVKAEALVRWKHPTRGMVSPAEFIPLAEQCGLIHAIGDFVFEQAARVAKTWNEQTACKGPGHSDAPLKISINRSPRQFFNRDGIAKWAAYLDSQHIPGALLTIEITEGLLLDDRNEVLEQLNELRALGMTLSLDDFGTGYSALSYLKKFTVDYLKIDRSFVREIDTNPSDQAIVEAIIVMAKRLGIKLVAEGVETLKQAELLAAVGCDLVQGYYYAKPMPEVEFLQFRCEGHSLAG